MELNETLQKVDHTLDSTVKKVEKQAKDMLAKELRIEVTKAQHGKHLPHPLIHEFSPTCSWCCRLYQEFLMGWQ